MINEHLTAKDKQDAYELIRQIYKFIPVYNQIKGTYLGIQFILNTMGLCAKIEELWRNRNDINNFSEDGTYYRESELGAVRRFISEIGSTKARVKDYYLTSRFDVDIVANKGISFYEFNGMAGTIIEVINAMRPVTRCLRKLFYIVLVNTDIHFNYLLDAEDDEYDNTSLIGRIITSESRSGDNTYGYQIRTFSYLWNVTEYPWNKKIVYDNRLFMLKKLYLPFNAIGAKFINADEIYNIGPNEDITNKFTHTLKNSYFNLCDLDRKLKKSCQKTFQFIVYARKKGEYRSIIQQEYKDLIIGEDISFTLDRNGIYVNFYNTIQTILGALYRNLDLSTVDLFFGTNFNIVLGSKYLYQDNNVPLDIWDVNEENDENVGLVTETSDIPYDITWLLDEATGQHNLLWESYK